MKHPLLVCLLLAAATTRALPQEPRSPQEIRVQLSTTSPLAPIYISHINQSDGSIPASYLQQLQAVIDNDMRYCGKFRLVARSQEKDQILSSANFSPTLAASQLGAAHMLRLTARQGSLLFEVIDSRSQTSKAFPELILTQKLFEDRAKIHKISDAILKQIFKEEAIASKRILYSHQTKHSSDSSKDIAEIWECDWDGHNAHPVTKEGSYCVTPVAITKAGATGKDLFLYVSYKTGQPKIYLSSFDEPRGKKVVDLRGNQLLPAVSKQKDKLAFICDASGRADLFLQTIDPQNGRMGTPLQLFSYPRSTQASPSFSPDGSKIAFASDKDGSTRIYVIPSMRTEKRAQPQLITRRNRENSCPSWSPDGTKLAYSAKTEGIRQIWIYDFSSGEEMQLTSGPGNKENPCWANNSLHIVFNSTDANSSDLYIVNLNQPEAIKITQGPGKKHYPTWVQR